MESQLKQSILSSEGCGSTLRSFVPSDDSHYDTPDYREWVENLEVTRNAAHFNTKRYDDKTDTTPADYIAKKTFSKFGYFCVSIMKDLAIDKIYVKCLCFDKHESTKHVCVESGCTYFTYEDRIMIANETIEGMFRIESSNMRKYLRRYINRILSKYGLKLNKDLCSIETTQFCKIKKRLNGEK